jgi:iron complex transport system permease protein
MNWIKNLPVSGTLGAVLVLLIFGLLFIGDVALPLRAFVESVTQPFSLSSQIIWGLRLPRSLCAAIVGAMLGLSGALLQGLLRNPLAEPGILGVSSGAG